MTSQFSSTERGFDERETLQHLMSLPEEDRFHEIDALLDQDSAMALKLANTALRNKQYFELLFERGLEKANASEIELWLKYLIARLGFKRVIAILSSQLSAHPQEVEKAIYWLPNFLPKNNDKASILLQSLLNKEKKMLSGDYKGIRPSGRVYKLILKIKTTGEIAVFGGYQLGSKGTKVIVEILDPNDFYPTGGVREVSPGDIEILDPQPYND